MTTTFAIELERMDATTVVVAVHGEVDLFTAPEFKAHVAEAVRSGYDTLVIDFSEANFLDSSSLGVLIGAHRKQTRRGGSLIIACDQERILKVLRITGLDSVFRIVASVEDALMLRSA